LPHGGFEEVTLNGVTYKKVDWRQVLVHQFPMSFEVHEEISEMDQLLWSLSVEDERKEVGVFEALDAKGDRVVGSPFFVGVYRSIPSDVILPIWDQFVEDVQRSPQYSSIVRIRLVHTHPYNLPFARDGEEVMFMKPEYLSFADLKAANYFRRDLHIRLSSADASKINFEVVAVTKIKMPLRHIQSLPSKWDRILAVLKLRKSSFMKSAVVFY
jgi:hypothetical protein